jgi:ribonuclease VapC
MMTVDASALLAIILKEEDAGTFRRVIASADSAVISAVNYWEVLVRAQVEFGPAGLDFAEELLVESRIRVEVADAGLARSAAAAFARFRGRPGGRLNLGDCFAYALAAREGDGLLFKGNDFPKTDVKRVLG